VRLLAKTAAKTRLWTVDGYAQRLPATQPTEYVSTEMIVPSCQIRILVKNVGITRAADVEVYAQQHYCPAIT
jgi:hypothetical protein